MKQTGARFGNQKGDLFINSLALYVVNGISLFTYFHEFLKGLVYFIKRSTLKANKLKENHSCVWLTD